MKRNQLAAAVAASLASVSAEAASEWTLTSLLYDSGGFESFSYLVLDGTLTFSEGPGNSLQADGAFSGTSNVGMTPVFTWNFGSDFAIDGSGTASGSFSCAEGLFGEVVGIHVCGNYLFGANGYNESTVNPDGTGRILGGDDVANGPAPQFSIDLFDGSLFHLSHRSLQLNLDDSHASSIGCVRGIRQLVHETFLRSLGGQETRGRSRSRHGDLKIRHQRFLCHRSKDLNR